MPKNWCLPNTGALTVPVCIKICPCVRGVGVCVVHCLCMCGMHSHICLFVYMCVCTCMCDVREAFCEMYSTAREQLSNYSRIFTNIHIHFLSIFFIYLNTLEYFVTFWYILEFSRIKWNDNDLGYSIISWPVFWNIHKYSQIFTLESCSRAVLYTCVCLLLITVMYFYCIL